MTHRKEEKKEDFYPIVVWGGDAKGEEPVLPPRKKVSHSKQREEED